MWAVRNILYGAIFGVANVIPGVSGGTMAVILNIYDRLMEALSFKNLKKHLWFLITLAIGAAAGIFAFSNAITYLLEHFPIATNFAFIGLIVGSLPMVFKRAGGTKPRMSTILCFAAGLAVMVGMGFLPREEIGGAVMTQLTVGNFFFLLVVSAVSAFAMILPGISGSLVMVIFGAYSTVIGAITDLNILILVPVAIGCLVGIVFGSKLVSTLMKRFTEPTYAAILGLIVGSLFTIFPGFSFDWQGAAAVSLLVVGAAVAYLFSVKQTD